MSVRMWLTREELNVFSIYWNMSACSNFCPNRITVKERLMFALFLCNKTKHYILPHLFIKVLKFLPSFLPFCLFDRGVNIYICLFQVSLQTPNWFAALLRFCFEKKTICCIQTRRWVCTWPLVYRLFFVWLLAVRRRIKNFPLPPTHSTLCCRDYILLI